MSQRILFLLCVVGCVLFPVGVLAQAKREDGKAQLITEIPKVVDLIVVKTNDFRKEQDRAAVTVNKKLTETAQYFADYMAKTGKFSHTADDQEPGDRAKKHDYDYCIVLENIANEFNSRGFKTEELGKLFVEGWKKSPGHRKNMLDADVFETGVAIAQSADTGYYYAVQMFGRPKSKMIEFSIANRSKATITYRIGEESFTLPHNVIMTHQLCRPEETIFQWPAAEKGGKEKTETVKPSNADHLIITREQNSFRIKKK